MPEPLPITNVTLTVTGFKDVTYQRTGDDGMKTPATLKIVKSGEAPDLSSFDTAHHPLLVPGAVLFVGYTEKYATNNDGSPKMDDYTHQQKVYRNIVSAAPYEAQPALPAQQAAPATQTPAAATGLAPGEVSQRELFSLHQTALNGAVSLCANGVMPQEDLYDVADNNFAWLMGQPMDALDRALKAGKDAGMTDDGGAGEAFTGPKE